MSLHNNDKRSKKLLFLMIIALVLLNAGLIYQLVTKNNKLQSTQVEMVDVSQQLTDLKVIEDELRVNLELKSGQNAKLDSIIELRNQEIQTQVNEIKNILAKGKLTKAELAKAKQRLSDFENQVDQLKNEIETLSQQNQYLRDENYVMQKQLAEEKQINKTIKTENSELVKKVEVGSRIFLKSIDVNPLHEALIGGFKTTSKLAKLDKLEITCTLANNDLAEEGEKTLYFQIVSPNKSTLHSDNTSSGTFKFDGGDRMYTIKKVVNFQNKNESVQFSIPKIEGMTEGTYTVHVYSDSNKMESTTFTLR
jgi:hypothetical protein